MPIYKALRPLSVAGESVAEGERFEADEEVVRFPLVKGWVEPMVQSEPKPRAKRAKQS
jgi:hypothetical protein